MEALDLTALPGAVLLVAEELVEETGLLAVADSVIDRTGQTSAVAGIVGDVADALVDFEELDLGVFGTWLESRDGDLVAFLVDVAISLALDEERRRRRQRRRAERKARRVAWWAELKGRRA